MDERGPGEAAILEALPATLAGGHRLLRFASTGDTCGPSRAGAATRNRGLLLLALLVSRPSPPVATVQRCITVGRARLPVLFGLGQRVVVATLARRREGRTRGADLL